MRISATLDKIHQKARKNKWLGYFAIFNRLALAAGFIPSGMVKILGERFTALPNNNPMGHYLEALFHTGYYYTFIGVMQVVAALLLLIPRTVTLGALIYLPIILNITLLSYSVRFDGSLLTAPLMVLACLFLLCWDYHKLKLIFPFNYNASKKLVPSKEERTFKFPFLFFTGVFVAVLAVAGTFILMNMYAMMPRNLPINCQENCADKENPAACLEFCECIHTNGDSLSRCLDEYEAKIE